MEPAMMKEILIVALVAVFMPHYSSAVCYELSTTGDNNDYTLDSGSQYVGPWITSISNVIDFEISTVTGSDISIFLSTVANLNSENLHYYQIILDDSNANFHGSATNGDTLLFRDGTGGTFLDDIVPNDGPAGLLKDDQSYSFWLRYEESSGSISMGDPSDRTVTLTAYSDGPTNALDVKHIFVKSSTSDSASFKICLPAGPKKIYPIGVNSVGYRRGGRPDKAIDGNRNPIFESDSCFVSSTVDDPWIRIDLGQVYDVRYVLIWPVRDNFAFGINGADIDGAQVFVGSCFLDRVAGNTLCFHADTGVVDNANPIEGECPAPTYGQYVYIYQPTTNTDRTQFSVCEIEVYGTDVPYGSETTVQFWQDEYVVNENDGGVTISTVELSQME
ncbi:uncharacterized protein [Amphiura filiformis]|uniref:uncharacterized protein isoform X2 n=1 Tax=Amphiura filiformis TaxID=82378 RepID=UPI003B2186BE